MSQYLISPVQPAACTSAGAATAANPAMAAQLTTTRGIWAGENLRGSKCMPAQCPMVAQHLSGDPRIPVSSQRCAAGPRRGAGDSWRGALEPSPSCRCKDLGCRGSQARQSRPLLSTLSCCVEETACPPCDHSRLDHCVASLSITGCQAVSPWSLHGGRTQVQRAFLHRC